MAFEVSKIAHLEAVDRELVPFVERWARDPWQAEIDQKCECRAAMKRARRHREIRAQWCHYFADLVDALRSKAYKFDRKTEMPCAEPGSKGGGGVR